MRKLFIEALPVLLVALTGYAAWWLYDLGKVHGVNELKSLRVEHRVLQGRYDKMVKDRNVLREHAAVLERSSQVDRQATQAVRDELGQLQENLQAAREEIRFYRGIVSPGDGSKGLQIHSFTLSEGLQPGEYRYDLVLTQLKRNDRYISGRVSWNIIGKQGDDISELDLAAVTDPETKYLEFRFRYFQHLTGVARLPEGYQAHELVLTVKATGKQAPEPLQATFAWPGTEN
ncbi:MAG: DUF6776 family protein [Pseudomonadota bacterium]